MAAAGNTVVVRLFVAVWPSAEVVCRLEALARPAVAGLRWTRPAQWHVTLAFLGEVPDDRVERVAACLQPTGERGRARAVLGPRTELLGPSVLCVPVAGLGVLAEAARGALVDGGCRPDERPYRGHLTVARARRGRRVPAHLVGTTLSGTWTVPALDLVASTLAPGGSQYRSVATITLAGPDSPSGPGLA